MYGMAIARHRLEMVGLSDCSLLVGSSISIPCDLSEGDLDYPRGCSGSIEEEIEIFFLVLPLFFCVSDFGISILSI